MPRQKPARCRRAGFLRLAGQISSTPTRLAVGWWASRTTPAPIHALDRDTRHSGVEGPASKEESVSGRLTDGGARSCTPITPPQPAHDDRHLVDAGGDKVLASRRTQAEFGQDPSDNSPEHHQQ